MDNANDRAERAERAYRKALLANMRYMDPASYLEMNRQQEAPWFTDMIDKAKKTYFTKQAATALQVKTHRFSEATNEAKSNNEYLSHRAVQYFERLANMYPGAALKWPAPWAKKITDPIANRRLRVLASPENGYSLYKYMTQTDWIPYWYKALSEEQRSDVWSWRPFVGALRKLIVKVPRHTVERLLPAIETDWRSRIYPMLQEDDEALTRLLNEEDKNTDLSILPMGVLAAIRKATDYFEIGVIHPLIERAIYKKWEERQAEIQRRKELARLERKRRRTAGPLCM